MDVVSTIPSALASGGCALHALVRVELTNGLVLTGRIIQMDTATMNMKLDALTDVSVREGSGEGNAVKRETETTALRCVSSIVVRGCHIRYIDFIDEEATGGRGLQELIAVASSVRPSIA